MIDKIKSVYRFISPKFQTVHLDYKVDNTPRYGHGKPPHKGLYDIINAERETYKEIIEEAVKVKERFFEIKTIDKKTNEVEPVYNSGFLPGLDIVGIYTLILKYKPKKFVEVGSGNSTKVAYKCIKDNNLSTEIISIDPMPRAEIDSLANKIERKPFEHTDFSFIYDLEPGDILFIDNSHRILPNSDSTVFYLEVLPKLKKGVIVHIHDIYLPYDYPQFMCDRYYSEQYGLAMFILANPQKYRTLFPNYFVSEDKELSTMLNPIFNHENLKGVERHGGSYWLIIN
jgi:hypothetical protein